MYSLSTNPSSITSKNDILNALIKMLKTYDYNDISITHICSVAKLTRPTFYRNFEEKDDVIRYQLDSIGKNFTQNIDINSKTVSLNKILCEYYEFLITYQDFLTLINNNRLEHILKENIKYMFSSLDIVKFNISPSTISSEFFIDYTASTICSILSLWINHNFKESPKELADITLYFFNGILK